MVKREKLTAMEVATQALDEIARHEKECGERWAEAHQEIKSVKSEIIKVREANDVHAKRWEKLAWMVGGCMVALAVAQLST